MPAWPKNGTTQWRIARGTLVSAKRSDGSSRQPHMQGRMRCQGATLNLGKHTIDAQHLEACWPKNGTKQLEGGEFQLLVGWLMPYGSAGVAVT